MCCKDCKDRFYMCHDTCDRYKEYKAKKEQAYANKQNYYLKPTAGFEKTVKNKIKNNKPLGNIRFV